MIKWSDFEKIDMRIGTILDAQEFPEARKPAYKLSVDFGEHGVRKSSAQITKRYKKVDLIGKQVIGVINFPPKQIGPFISECLILGVYGENDEVVLIKSDQPCPNGSKIG